MTWRLYYANQLIETWAEHPLKPIYFPAHLSARYSSEIYNGGYLHDSIEEEWYRCDGTPVLLEDVPKELRVRLLIDPT